MFWIKDAAYTFSRPIAVPLSVMNRQRKVTFLVLTVLTSVALCIAFLPEAHNIRNRIKDDFNKMVGFFRDPTHKALVGVIVVLFYSTVAYKLRKEELQKESVSNEQQIPFNKKQSFFSSIFLDVKTIQPISTKGLYGQDADHQWPKVLLDALPLENYYVMPLVNSRFWTRFNRESYSDFLKKVSKDQRVIFILTDTSEDVYHLKILKEEWTQQFPEVQPPAHFVMFCLSDPYTRAVHKKNMEEIGRISNG